jgi:formate-dependent phosphoribosylglycinamide formyltransferase (GAR transformylase)
MHRASRNHFPEAIARLLSHPAVIVPVMGSSLEHQSLCRKKNKKKGCNISAATL